MDINRSRAVDSFKLYGHRRYKGAQRFPIDIYKDTLLFHEFVENIALSVYTNRHSQHVLKTMIKDWHTAYRQHNYDHPIYGGFIEVMYRRRITTEHVKAFLQSMLLNTTHITYHNDDELQAYIYGTAEVVGLIMCDIIGCAPSGHLHAQALGEGLWIIHMLLDLRQDRERNCHYIPQTILDKHELTPQDILHCCYIGRASDKVTALIKQYVDEHESLCSYGLKGLGYLNKSGHQGVLVMVDNYEQMVKLIKEYNYNVFHPRFRHGLISKIMGYGVYRFGLLVGTK